MKKLMRKKLALMLANLKKKRPYYVECEYLESTGTQYIDLGITSKSSMRAKAKFNLANVSAQAIFGSATVSATGVGVFFGTASTGVVYCNKTDTPISPSLTLVANTNYEFDMSLTTVSINGVNYTASTTSDNNYNMLLFARILAGNVDRRISGKIYYFKLYDNGVLIRDMIPVLDWNMTPCMYDKVTEQLFYNAGTGDFIAGREIHPVEYLESTGTQYIDTGLKGGLDTFAIDAKLSCIGGIGKYYILGNFNQTGHSGIMINTSDTSKVNFVYYLAGASSHVRIVVSNANTDFKISTLGRKIKVNNTEIADIPVNTKKLTNSNLMLWGTGINTAFNAYGKCYYLKIWDNNTLVRDFIPCIDQNGIAFMFDRVTHTCFLNAGTGTFKYPAREVEYLESTGTQYIDTGYNPNSNTKVEAKFKMNETANTFRWLFSSRNQALAGDGYGFGAVANGFIDSEYNSRVSSTADKLTNGTVYTIVKDKNVCRYNDSVLINPESTFTVNYSLPIFALNNVGTIELSSYTKANCYYFKIYDNDILVRDFIPCYKDGVACMVDKLTGTAYLNQGTGTFTTGKIVESEYE